MSYKRAKYLSIFTFLMLSSFVSLGQQKEVALHKKYEEQIEWIRTAIKGTAGENDKALEKLEDQAQKENYQHPYLQDLITVKIAELKRVSQISEATALLKDVSSRSAASYPYFNMMLTIEKGYINLTQKNCEKSLDQFLQADEWYQQCSELNPSVSIKSYLMNGTVQAYMCLNQNDKAMEVLNQMEQFVIANDLKHSVLFVYSNMGYLHNKARNYPDAIKYYKKGLQSSKVRKDSALFLGNLGAMYFMKEKLDSSVYYLELSLEIARSGPKDKLLSKLINLGAINLELGEPMRALELGEEALAIAEENGLLYPGLKARELMANALYDLERYEASLVLCNEVIPGFDSLGSMNNVENALQLKGEVLIAMGKPEEAAAAFQKKSELMDSLAMQNEITKLQETMIKYETEKKEQAIKELEHAQKLADLRAENQKIRIRYLIIGLVILLVLSGIIFYLQWQRSRQKRKAMLLKISKTQFDPHFLNNAFGTLQSLFIKNTDPEKSINYVNRLSRFSRLILESRVNESWSLQEEENTNINYLEIQQFRLSDKFSFSYEKQGFTEEGYEKILIPTAFLQPLLENCIDYNIEGKTGDPHLKLTISKRESNIRCEILTTGGKLIEHLSEDQMENKDQVSRGAEILKKRMRLFFGKNNYAFNIVLLPNKHSRTTIEFKIK